jgi:hypothetical protein
MRRTAGLYFPTNCSYVTLSADVLKITGNDLNAALVLQVFLDRFMDECEWLDIERKFDDNPWIEMSHQDISRETLFLIPASAVAHCINHLTEEKLLTGGGGRYQLNAAEFNRRARALDPKSLDHLQPSLFTSDGVL